MSAVTVDTALVPRSRMSTVATPDEAVVVVTGDLDIAGAPTLRRALDEVSRGEHRRVVVDASGVEFLDAAGVGALLSARRHLAAAGRELAVRNPSPPARRVLEVVGLGDLVEGQAA